MDAAENSFIPICVYNNTKNDADALILGKFKESAWNNPVVRFIDRNEKDIVRGITRKWTVPALVNAMLKTLKKKNKNAPEYLKILAREEIAKKRGTQTAVFGMG